MMCYYTFDLYYYYRFINLIGKGYRSGTPLLFPIGFLYHSALDETTS